MARCYHAGTVDRATARRAAPFHSAVVRLEAGSLAALRGLELRQGSARWACRYVSVGLDRFMIEPQRDYTAIDAGLQQFHRGAVPQHARGNTLLAFKDGRLL